MAGVDSTCETEVVVVVHYIFRTMHIAVVYEGENDVELNEDRNSPSTLLENLV